MAIKNLTFTKSYPSSSENTIIATLYTSFSYNAQITTKFNGTTVNGTSKINNLTKSIMVTSTINIQPGINLLEIQFTQIGNLSGLISSVIDTTSNILFNTNSSWKWYSG